MKTSASTIAAEVIEYLKKNDAYQLVGEVASILQEEAYRNQVVTVISANTLNPSEQKDIQSLLVAKWGEHPFRFLVDPSLVSGMIVTFQDKIIDQSGRGALSDLQQTLVTS